MLREIARLLPTADLLYVGDSAFCPYGAKSTEVLRTRIGILVEFLLAEGAEIVVLACNSATIQAVEWCRAEWPGVTFVGMEPGVKPAVSQTQTGVIGVLATEASLTGEMFRKLVDRCCVGCQVLTQACPEFVELVERGIFSGEEVEEAVRQYAGPLVAGGADVIVLGCSHYPFLQEVIERLYPQVTLINTGPAVARRVQELSLDSVDTGQGELTFWTSGELAQMQSLLPMLAPELVGEIRRLDLPAVRVGVTSPSQP